MPIPSTNPELVENPDSYSADSPYGVLNEFFVAHQDEIVEVEVLPSALAPTEGLVLKDGINLGVPKKVLVQAYLTARTTLFAHQTNLSIDTVSIHFPKEKRRPLLS